jgi:ParB family chromosome partitioning protein
MAAWKTVVQRHLSVRQTEALIRRLNRESAEPKPSVADDAAYFTHVAEELSRHFGTKVDIQRRGRRGRVKIEFYGDEDLDRLLGLLRPS